MCPNVGIKLIGPWEINFSGIVIKFDTFYFTKLELNMGKYVGSMGQDA